MFVVLNFAVLFDPQNVLTVDSYIVDKRLKTFYSV